MRLFLSKLGPLKWTLHNVIGHPLMEILSLFGLKRASDWVHDVTTPLHTPMVVISEQEYRKIWAMHAQHGFRHTHGVGGIFLTRDDHYRLKLLWEQEAGGE